MPRKSGRNVESAEPTNHVGANHRSNCRPNYDGIFTKAELSQLAREGHTPAGISLLAALRQIQRLCSEDPGSPDALAE